MEDTNIFDQLVNDLLDGSLTLTHLQIAIRTYIRRRKNFPIYVKGLLAGEAEGDSGLIGLHFRVITQTIAAMELVHLRTKQHSKPALT